MFKNNIASVIKEVNLFSLPLILNNVFNLLISVVITSIVGRISIGAIISTEIVDTLNYAILGIAGVGTLVFNMESSKVRISNIDEFYDWFKSCCLVNGVIGLIIVIIVQIFSKEVFSSIYRINGQELDIICKYAYIISFSVFANMIIFSMTNLLKVNKKTKYIFYSGILGSILQVILAYLLVYKILSGNYKILGVAISSTITVFFQLMLYMYILRKDIKKSIFIKTSKKTELVIKSIPLMLQEVLEGSVFSVLIITLITRLGNDVISAYSIDLRIVSLCLMPMYMYCNSLTVLVGEYYSKKEYENLKILPVVTTVITLFVYVIISVLLYIYRVDTINILTNIDSVKKFGLSLLTTILIFSAFQIFFENSKYALQSIGQSKQVLKITILVNSLSSILLITLSFYNLLNLKIILIILSLNYLTLSIIFYLNYSKEIRRIN